MKNTNKTEFVSEFDDKQEKIMTWTAYKRQWLIENKEYQFKY